MNTDIDTPTGQLLGYCRVSTAHQSNDAQHDVLVEAGVNPERIYVDKLTGTSTKEQRPGLSALLDYARPGDVIVVKGVDRLGRSVAEVMTTVKDLLTKGIVIRALREGVDSSTPTGRAVMGIMASMAELELELQRERVALAKAARKARGGNIGRPNKRNDPALIRQAEALRTAGEPVDAIAKTLNRSRATIYRILSENAAK
ncbi:recombinase family protein [Mycolicibacterium llatzerense]|uniref:recombinase family protein n=1 Tax=Mycolicibacterium llatzerense TaxID=280871 RepID=UPI0008DCBFE0|nr:recombinase family protein [Mycolicibacterium llatzerense]